MKQAKVKKTETINGIPSERIMTLPLATWERIVADKTPLRNVKWELLGAPSVPKEKELIENTGTKHLVEGADSPDYSNYSTAELREACKSAGITFNNLDSVKKLIAKLNANA